MVTVFGILNLTEDSFFDESRRLDPAGAVTAAIEMLRVGSDVVDVGPAASHPDARPVSPADEIRRIAPLLDALSDQMHRVSIDSFQPETQRYALKRGVGYLNDIQGFPDPALYPDIAEADCRLVVMHSAQRDGIAALLQRLAAVRGRLSLCADQAAAAKWWLSMPMASVSAEGPMPKALSTRRTSPLMPGCRHQGRACPLRRARMTSNPLIVA